MSCTTSNLMKRSQLVVSTESFHGCSDCSFHLHTQCFNAPLHLQHPSHPSHPLTLLPNPKYTSQSYSCDACGFNGEIYCYSCSSCDYDIHLRCANLPLSLLIDEHEHELKLFLTSPYNDGGNLICDLCQGMKESNLWSYYCEECDFGTHVGCAMKFKDAPDCAEDSSRSTTSLEDLPADCAEDSSRSTTSLENLPADCAEDLSTTTTSLEDLAILTQLRLNQMAFQRMKDPNLKLYYMSQFYSR